MALIKYLEEQHKIEVTVWENEEDETGTVFASVIEELQADRFMIKIPNSLSKQLGKAMEPGLLVGVLLMSTQKPVVFYPKVESFVDDGLPRCWLAFSPSTSYEVIERRRHVRIATQLPIRVESTGQVTEGTAINMSGGGLRFVSSREFQMDHAVLVHIPCTDPQKDPTLKQKTLLKAQGKVVFSQTNYRAKSPDERYVTGVFFSHLTQMEEDLLMKEIFQWELGLKTRPKQ